MYLKYIFTSYLHEKAYNRIHIITGRQIKHKAVAIMAKAVNTGDTLVACKYQRSCSTKCKEGLM